MTGKETIDEIISAVKEAQDKGSEHIDTKALLQYLTKLHNNESIDHEFLIENFKANQQYNLEVIKLQVSAQIEAFKSVITVGANAVRHILLINGGAAIALLAFLGNIWEKKSTDAAISGISFALMIFCCGVLASGLCASISYISQYCYGQIHNDDKDAENAAWNRAALTSNILAVVMALASLVFFAWGAYEAFQSVGAQFSVAK